MSRPTTEIARNRLYPSSVYSSTYIGLDADLEIRRIPVILFGFEYDIAIRVKKGPWESRQVFVPMAIAVVAPLAYVDSPLLG